MSKQMAKPLCAWEELIQRLGYELVHDGLTKPAYPVQGNNNRYFTRIYRREFGERIEEAIFKYDLRDGKRWLVYTDVVWRDSYGVRQQRQRMVQRLES